MDDVWINIATYNEAENLPEVLERLVREVPTAHITIVDDDSPDGTGEIADQWAAAHPRIQAIHRTGKLGYASAHQEGFRHAVTQGAQVFLIMDADLSHDPAAIPMLIEALGSADVAVGSRYVPGGSTPGWPWHRQFLSRLGNVAFRWIGGLPAKDNTSGFRAFRIDAAERIGLSEIKAEGYAFGTIVMQEIRRERCSIKEVPIQFVDRQRGKSKMSSAIISEQLRLLMKLFWARLRSV